MNQPQARLGRCIYPGASLTGFHKPELIEALALVQHFLPPRPSRQDVSTLRAAARCALSSERYGAAMADALRAVRRKTNNQTESK